MCDVEVSMIIKVLMSERHGKTNLQEQLHPVGDRSWCLHESAGYFNKLHDEEVRATFETRHRLAWRCWMV